MVEQPQEFRYDLSNPENQMLIYESFMDTFKPIQKNSRLFKFTLYTTKVEIKFNSLINLIYTSSILEFTIWFFGFLVFIASPKNLYLIWLLIGHIGKGIIGLYLLRQMPKTHDIIENLAQNPSFDESKIIELIQKQIRDSFMEKWSANKKHFFAYMVITIVCIVIDFIMFIVQVAVFGKDEWILMQTCMLFIMVVFIVLDVIYFLWIISLQFTLPEEVLNPIKKAVFGSEGELKRLIWRKTKKSETNNNNNN